MADGMEPIRRPFADWVENRVVPVFEARPWLGFLLMMGLQSLLVGRWAFLFWLAVMGVWGLWSLIHWEDWRRWERMEQKRANHICLHCGYDMRATPERCSECGHWADEPVEL